MNQRYLMTIMPLISTCDKAEVDAKLTSNYNHITQFAAEYSYLSYLELIRAQNPVLGDYTTGFEHRQKEREYMVDLISFLTHKKKYKNETFHIAVSIVDRYLIALFSNGGEAPDSATLATVAVLMAAKLEQSTSPSFTRMVNTLPQ